MEVLELLQTIGIRVAALALAAIALMLFMLISSLTLAVDDEPDEADPLAYLRGKSPEEIGRILRTPVPPSQSKGRERAGKSSD